jgi:N-acetylglucosaminyl-diphospho-decaprenol L-rhamnosyltransferase
MRRRRFFANRSPPLVTRSSSPRVGAVIVNWRTPESTIRAARALLADGLDPGNLTIVDDGSGDESGDEIRGALDVRVVQLTENVGYGRACNAGAETLAGCDVLLFVNSDAYLHRTGSVNALVEALARPDVMLAVPRLLNDDLTLQPSVVPFRTPLSAAAQASGLTRFVPNALQPRLGTYWDHRTSRAVQSATGAVIASTAAAWRALGGFRPVALMYGEDHDLCWRVHELGGSTWFTAEAEFVHAAGASTELAYTPAIRARHVAAAEAAVLRRHLTPRRAALTVAILRGGHAGRAVVFRALGRDDAAAMHRGFAVGFATPLADDPYARIER